MFDCEKLAEKIMNLFTVQDTKFFDIDFDGHVKARVEITNNEPKIFAAMNGYGNPIELSNINIKRLCN